MPNALLATSDVHRSYGRIKALSGVSFEVHPGDRILLLGANGSGKSTLLKMCAKLLRPDRGTVVADCPVGYLGHQSGLYGDLTVAENLELYGGLGAGSAGLGPALARWGLESYRSTPFAELSKGQQAKIAIVRVLLAPARVLLFDEPTANLDAEGVSLLVRELSERDSECATVIATHDVARLLPFATRIVVLESGKTNTDSGAEGDVSSAVEAYHDLNR